VVIALEVKILQSYTGFANSGSVSLPVKRPSLEWS